MTRLQAGYYQDVYQGKVFAVAKRKSTWECQWELNGSWCGGFKSKKDAAKHAKLMIMAINRGNEP